MAVRYPTQAELRRRFTYDSERGMLAYALPARGMRVGDTAGSAQCKGRVWQIQLNGPRLSAARLVWIWHNGDIPEDCVVRFKDGNGLNLRIENLYLRKPVHDVAKPARQGFGFMDDRTGAHFEGFRTKAQAAQARETLRRFYTPHPDYERLA